MNEKPVLSLKDVDVFYDEVQALFGISIEVFEKDIVSIIGSNGAGKTTAMRAVMGLCAAAKGSIVFEGEDITKTKCHDIVHKGIIYVPEGCLIFPDATVQADLLHPDGPGKP